jgi:hypothetical protein
MSTSGGNFFITQSNDDVQASLTILFASSPRDCQAEEAKVLTIAFALSPWRSQA